MSTKNKVKLKRLELIRKRHRELILDPRETFAEDFEEADFDDSFDELSEVEELQYADAVG